MAKRIGKIFIRVVLVSIYAILVMKLVDLAMPDDIEFNPPIPKYLFILFYLLFFNLNIEGNIFFDRYINKKLQWFIFPKKRLVVQLGFIIMWSLITIALPFTVWYYINGQSLTYPPASVLIFVGSIVFLMGLIGIPLTINFFKQWQVALLDAEHYKQEKLKAEYRVLQNQVNPHFLFNSLNVLISEIKHNPNTAVEFTRKLSKVYRYVLQSKNHDLIALSKELDFIDSYIFLHKVRIGDALDYSVNISEEIVHMQIPPLTLQILIENAIKHNITNEENVLKILIKSEKGSTLIVSNNLQAIENADSTYTGLSNLTKRFELLKKDGFTYGENKGNFVVTVPLIDE